MAKIINNCELLVARLDTGARIFSSFRSFSLCMKIVTPCSTGFGLLAGPWSDSDSETENINESLLTAHFNMYENNIM